MAKGAPITEGSSMKRSRIVVVASGVVLVAAVALAATLGGSASAQGTAKQPITIGWAYDLKGQMAPFDNPALAVAEIRIKQFNAKGGDGGRKFGTHKSE